MIITQEIQMFREAARHLWNNYLRRDANWDSVDAFRDICRILFNEQIIFRSGINVQPILVDVEGNFVPKYKISMKGNGKIPLYVNRDLPSSGYWDYPIDWIPPEDDQEIRPISFFDFDTLGWRMIEYYRVRIIKCRSYPELAGRDALIRCDYVDLVAEEEKKESETEDEKDKDDAGRS